MTPHTVHTDSAVLDPLEIAVWASTMAMIAEEMGAVLIRGALSPNIRERRDASCALFDAEGEMVAQAAHIPVHLGALPEAVRAVRACAPDPGDVFLLNSPWHGARISPISPWWRRSPMEIVWRGMRWCAPITPMSAG